MRARQAGFTLIEIIIAVSILIVALVGLLSAILHITRLNAVNREKLAVMRGAEKMLETMRNTAFEQIFTAYNAPAADDPFAGAPGADFDVDDLQVLPGDPDGKCGKIVFPTDGTGAQLDETTADADLMLPRDLDGDGVIGIAGDYRLLPVTIQIDWQSITGPRTWTYRTLLLDKSP